MLAKNTTASAPRSGFQLDEQISSEESVQQFLPYECQFDDHTIALREGEYMRVIELVGVPYSNVTPEQQDDWTMRLNLVLRSIANPKITIWHNAVKKRVHIPKSKPVANSYVQDFQNDYDNKLSKKKLYKTTHYLTVIVRNPNNLTLNVLEKVASLFEKGLGAKESGVRASKLSELDKAVARVKSGLSDYKPRLLGVYKRNEHTISEVQSFLYFLINGHESEVKLTDRVVRSVLPTARPFFKKSYGQLTHHRYGAKCFGSLSIKEYTCKTTSVDSLSSLLYLDSEYVFTQTFEFQTTDDAIEELEKQQRSLHYSGDKSFTDISDLEDAMDEVASRKSVFGLSTMHIIVFGDSQKELRHNMDEADRCFSTAQLITIRDDIILEAKWWAQLPGNFKYRTRVTRISSLNFASFSPIQNEPSEGTKTFKWGEPYFIAETLSGSPYYFSTHVGELGNTIIIGRSRSGKTVIMVAMALMMSKFNGRVFYFDKDRGAEIGIRAVGGNYYVISPGKKTGFNPCQLPDTPSNRKFLYNLIETMVSDETGVITAQEAKIVESVVAGNFEYAPEMRRMRYLEPLFPQGDEDALSIRFSRWVNDGIHAWLFDNESDVLDVSCTHVGYDMTDILDEKEVRGPALSYMTHRVKSAIDGSPIAIFVDEGWKGLQDEMFAADMKNWAKVIAKQEGILVFGSQEARDLSNSAAGQTLITQSATKLFGFDPEGVYENYVDFGVSPVEFETIKSLQRQQFLVKNENYSCVITLDLSGLDKHLAVISSRTKSVNLVEKLRDLHGDEPINWLNHFFSNIESSLEQG